MQTNYAFMDLSNTDFSHQFLHSCNFAGSNLQGCNFSHCTLSYSNFRSANLDGANLTSCNLLGADLSKANLEGVNFALCIGNGVDVFSMQLQEVPFVWTKQKLFIGTTSIEIAKFVKNPSQILENLTHSLGGYLHILTQAINLTIGE